MSINRQGLDLNKIVNETKGLKQSLQNIAHKDKEGNDDVSFKESNSIVSR